MQDDKITWRHVLVALIIGALIIFFVWAKIYFTPEVEETGTGTETETETNTEQVNTEQVNTEQVNTESYKPSVKVWTVPKEYFTDGEIETIWKANVRNSGTAEDFFILLAIRKAEDGGPGKEFGIMNPKAWNTDLDTQAGWAAATVVKNRARWVKAGKPGDFIEFLGERYAPVGADNDPENLNVNWVPNVTYWHEKFKEWE